MKGNLTRRGERSWRLKYDIASGGDGERQTRYVTLRGTKAQAQAEAAKVLAGLATGMHVDPDTTTVAAYLKQWLQPEDEQEAGEQKAADHPTLGRKTVERYKQLAQQQINPHLGGVQLQKLKPKQIQDWHQTLLT
ncbi:MAG TPA: hypothetical protein VGJ20_41400 [Xanthobacteraceae bacterium]|jgi:hypothetical protein